MFERREIWIVLGWPENEFCPENFRLTSRIRSNHLMLGEFNQALSLLHY